MKSSFFLVLCLSLVACQSTSKPLNPLFVPENSYTGLPVASETLANEAFLKGLEEGSLILISSALQQQQRIQAEVKFQANLVSLASINRSLIAQTVEHAKRSPDSQEEKLLHVNAEPVKLLSLNQQLEILNRAVEKSQSRENALASYETSFLLLPEALKASLPSPEELKNASFELIAQALDALEIALDPEILNLEKLKLSHDFAAQNLSAGDGTDNSGLCQPRELYRLFNWPLKAFISPVKNQAKRGTCWAFTTTSALESRELVQRDAAYNLSEQFLVNKIKQDWDDNDYEDGYNYDSALEDLIDNNQVLPEESFWTYNPSRNRDLSKEDEESYRNACQNYSGTCSETAHQSQVVCTLVLGMRFCAYEASSFSGTGVSASESVQIWSSGDPFRMNNYRYLLSQGYSLMASFGVRIGFEQPERGFVTDYRDLYIENGEEKTGDRGGHAVLIVGFIDNESIRSYRDGGGFPLEVPGGLPESGGFFVIKNSWGCSYGDGGFVYIPAEYIERYFYDLSILRMDTLRSNKWQQLNGGGSLQILATEGLAPRADLRIGKKLFELIPPKNSSIADLSVQISSSVPSDQFKSSQTFNTASYTGYFSSPGPRTVEVIAQLGVSRVQQTFSVDVINTAPSIELLSPNVIYAGEKVTLSANLLDKNEANPGNMCKRLEWFFTAPDIPFGSDGSCSRVVAFGQAGERSISLSTTDSEGQRTTQVFSVFVSEAPSNPFPRIAEAFLHEPDRLVGNDVDAFCQLGARIPDGNQIDLSQTESSYSCLGSSEEPTITRPFEATVVVENPDNHTLTYTWKLWVNSPETLLISEEGATTYPIPFYSYGSGDAAFNCGVIAEVSYPISNGRSVRSQNVWSGQCLFPALVPK